jgi:hypothetical protein
MSDTSELLTLVRVRVREQNINDPIHLVSLVMQTVEDIKDMSGKEKRMVVVNIMAEIAKGADGVAGTSDDLLPHKVVLAIKAMIEHDVLNSTIDIIVDATKGKLNINKMQNCVFSFIGCLRDVGCSKSKRQSPREQE